MEGFDEAFYRIVSMIRARAGGAFLTKPKTTLLVSLVAKTSLTDDSEFDNSVEVAVMRLVDGGGKIVSWRHQYSEVLLRQAVDPAALFEEEFSAAAEEMEREEAAWAS